MSQPLTPSLRKPNYGVDAPGLVRIFFVGGGLAVLTVCLSPWLLAVHPAIQFALQAIALIVTVYMLGMGTLMLVWSKVVKLKTRDRMLDRIEWRGDERVLDVGCGRGLLLIGAAKRLTTGRAIGIDIWQAADQSGNTPQAAMENMSREGVGDRAEIATGDMRALAFDDAAFDVVVSHWVVHNLSLPADRVRAIEEMARVLRPGGRLLLADIENRDEYTNALQAAGFVEIDLVVDRRWDRLLRAVSFGSFGPAMHYATRPGVAPSVCDESGG